MITQWQCNFNKPPLQITIGQKLLILCKGDKKASLTAPIRIDFLDNKQAYSLYVLKTVKKEPHFLALEVTSYRTGKFNSPFIITDGKESLLIKNLSFSVQSVLNQTEQPVQPHGPFGPFKPPLPIWYLSATILTSVCLIVCLFSFLNRLFKRKRFIQTVLNRKTYLDPSKSFIINLRKQKDDSIHAIKKLETLFKIFLEDLLFIPAIGKTNNQIMSYLKKYHRHIYKQEGHKLYQILNEISALKQSPGDKTTFLKLKNICQDMVFLLEKNKRRKLNGLA